MIFNVYVRQNQWIVATLMAGAALVLLFGLTYWAMWRPREEESRGEGIHIDSIRTFFRWTLSFMPWVLVLLIVGTVAYTVIHVVLAANTSPNW